MARETKKTSPIGVRFDLELLEAVTLASLADSPQKALNLYERSYIEFVELKVKLNNIPEKKDEIIEDKEAETANEADVPLTVSECVEKLPKKQTMRERIEAEKLKFNTKK